MLCISRYTKSTVFWCVSSTTSPLGYDNFLSKSKGKHFNPYFSRRDGKNQKKKVKLLD